MIRSYKDLIVWQKSFSLVKQIYLITDDFPKSEIYGLTSQMRRAAISIPSNIAEGCARKYRKEYHQFISVALGSGAELETQLFLAKDLKMISEKNFQEIIILIEEIMRMLNSLESKLK